MVIVDELDKLNKKKIKYAKVIKKERFLEKYGLTGILLIGFTKHSENG